MTEQRFPAAAGPGRARTREALAWSGGFVVVLWLVELLDVFLPAHLDAEGIRPGQVEGLGGVLFAPLLHAGWGHLMANSVPLLVLGFLLALSGVRRGLGVTAVVWLTGASAPGSPAAPAPCTWVPPGWCSGGWST